MEKGMFEPFSIGIGALAVAALSLLSPNVRGTVFGNTLSSLTGNAAKTAKKLDTHANAKAAEAETHHETGIAYLERAAELTAEASHASDWAASLRRLAPPVPQVAVPTVSYNKPA
jgi:hypothetical protein